MGNDGLGSKMELACGTLGIGATVSGSDWLVPSITLSPNEKLPSSFPPSCGRASGCDLFGRLCGDSGDAKGCLDRKPPDASGGHAFLARVSTHRQGHVDHAESDAASEHADAIPGKSTRIFPRPAGVTRDRMGPSRNPEAELRNGQGEAGFKRMNPACPELTVPYLSVPCRAGRTLSCRCRHRLRSARRWDPTCR